LGARSRCFAFSPHRLPVSRDSAPERLRHIGVEYITSRAAIEASTPCYPYFVSLKYSARRYKLSPYLRPSFKDTMFRDYEPRSILRQYRQHSDLIRADISRHICHAQQFQHFSIASLECRMISSLELILMIAALLSRLYLPADESRGSIPAGRATKSRASHSRVALRFYSLTLDTSRTAIPIKCLYTSAALSSDRRQQAISPPHAAVPRGLHFIIMAAYLRYHHFAIAASLHGRHFSHRLTFQRPLIAVILELHCLISYAPMASYSRHFTA